MRTPSRIVHLAAATTAILALTAPTPARRTLTFEQRVDAQRAIERVYYSHQIGASRPFDEAVPRELLERKVRAYLRLSVALEKIWKTPVTAEALRREMSRIEGATRLPEGLARYVPRCWSGWRVASTPGIDACGPQTQAGTPGGAQHPAHSTRTRRRWRPRRRLAAPSRRSRLAAPRPA